MADPSAILLIYCLSFLYIEPLSAVAGSCYASDRPAGYLSYLTASPAAAVTRTFTPLTATLISMYQLSNLYCGPRSPLDGLAPRMVRAAALSARRGPRAPVDDDPLGAGEALGRGVWTVLDVGRDDVGERGVRVCGCVDEDSVFAGAWAREGRKGEGRVSIGGQSGNEILIGAHAGLW